MLQTQNFIGNFNSIINALECIPLEILNIKLFSSSKLMDGRSIDGKKKFKLKKLIQFPRDIYNYNMYFLKTIFVIYPKKKKRNSIYILLCPITLHQCSFLTLYF